MKKTAVIILTLGFVMAAGCPDKQTRTANRRDDLLRCVQDYNEHLSWREFDKAAAYVTSQKRSHFLSWSEPLKRGFTLESFYIKDVEISPSQERAAVVVIRSYIISPSITLTTEEFAQEWIVKDGAWYLSGPPY